MAPSSRSSKACTECRQVKLRCDSKHNFPDPCSRCKSRRLVCAFDPSFKRTPTKGQLEKVTKQLAELRGALGISNPQEIPGLLPVPQIFGVPSSVDSQSDYGSPESDRYANANDEPETYFGLDKPGSPSQMYRLGSFHLPMQQVRAILLQFARFQHRHLPIVDTRRSYDEIYEQTPFLFWSMIAVSIRGSTGTLELLDSIQKQFNTYLGQVMIQSPLSLSTIQGLLLVCLWPFPVRHQREDPSWNLCNIALGATSNLEITTSFRSSTKKNDLDDNEQARCRTWLACFQVSSWLGSNLAVRPPLRNVEDLHNISKALSTGCTTKEFAAHIELQRQVANYTSVLTSDQGLFNSPSAIQMFEKELNSISSRFGDDWTLSNDFALLVARLDLYSSVIMSASKEMSRSSHSNNTPSPNSLVGTSLFKGFQAAVKLIALYEKLMEGTVSTSASSSPQDPNTATPIKPTYLSYPKYYHFTFAKATLFLLRFSLSRDSGFVESDRDIARNHIRRAHDLFVAHTQRPDDEPARVARVIDTLAKIQGTESAERLGNVVATHGELEIVRAAARHAAAIDRRETSWEKPVPEAPAYTPDASADGHSAGGNNSAGVLSPSAAGIPQIQIGADASLNNLQELPLEQIHPDWGVFSHNWLPPYFDLQTDQGWDGFSSAGQQNSQHDPSLPPSWGGTGQPVTQGSTQMGFGYQATF
jgi:hypothetical protein